MCVWNLNLSMNSWYQPIVLCTCRELWLSTRLARTVKRNVFHFNWTLRHSVFLSASSPGEAYPPEFYYDTYSPLWQNRPRVYGFKLQWTQMNPNAVDRIVAYRLGIRQVRWQGVFPFNISCLQIWSPILCLTQRCITQLSYRTRSSGFKASKYVSLYSNGWVIGTGQPLWNLLRCIWVTLGHREEKVVLIPTLNVCTAWALLAVFPSWLWLIVCCVLHSLRLWMSHCELDNSKKPSIPQENSKSVRGHCFREFCGFLQIVSLVRLHQKLSQKSGREPCGERACVAAIFPPSQANSANDRLSALMDGKATFAPSSLSLFLLRLW